MLNEEAQENDQALVTNSLPDSKKEEEKLYDKSGSGESPNDRAKGGECVAKKRKQENDHGEPAEIKEEPNEESITAKKQECKKLNDELQQVKSDKTRLEIEISSLKKSISQLAEENGHKTIEMLVLKESTSKLSNELKEIKQHLEGRENLIAKLNEEICVTRNKEMQIRKIAKRYKDSFFDLKYQGKGKADTNYLQGMTTTTETPPKTDELQSQLNMLQDENISMKKDIEALKLSLDKEEREKSLLKEEKHRLIELIESNQLLTEELQQLRNKLLTIEQTKSDLTSNLSTQQAKVVTQLTKENEELSTEINHLNRQIALQSVKPMPASTSGDTVSIDSV